MSTSPIVSFECNVLLMYSTHSPASIPWQVHFHTVDYRNYISLKAENHHAIKKMSGIIASGEWLGYIHMMISARDEAVSQFIDTRFESRDDRRPNSFHVAYLEANVPKTMQIGMPGYNEAKLMWVQTSARKGMSISIELTPENMSHVFGNLKHYHDNPSEVQGVGAAHDTCDDESDEGSEGIVKSRWNNGRRSYMVNWRDMFGTWRKKWMSPKSNGMKDHVKQELMRFYEQRHVPEGMTSNIHTSNVVHPTVSEQVGGTDACMDGTSDAGKGDSAGSLEATLDQPEIRKVKDAEAKHSLEQMQNFWLKRARTTHHV